LRDRPIEKLVIDQLDPGQGDGTELELGLQGNRIDRVVGHRVDRQVFAKYIVPVERRKTVARPHAVGDHRRQYGTPAAGAHLHAVLVLDAQAGGVFGVQFDEGAGVEFVQGGDLAGLGQGVPLVLQTPGVEHEREGLIRHLRRRHMRARQELALAVLGGESERACIQVADRVAVRAGV